MAGSRENGRRGDPSRSNRSPAPRVSPINALVLGASIAGAAYTSIRLELTQTWSSYGAAAADNRILFHAPLLALAALSVYFLLVASPVRFRIALAVKAAILCLYLRLLPDVGFRPETAIIAALVMEIAVYEAFHVNLLEASALIPLAVLMRALSLAHTSAAVQTDGILRAAALPSLESGLYLSLLATSACLLIHYRERCIDQEDKLRQLNDAVTELARANLGYQHYASQAEERSQSEERNRITRELHDILGYTFTNNIMMLEAAVSRIKKDPAKVQELISLARENAKTGLEKVRSSLYLLRSQEPVPIRSVNRFHKLVDTFRVATGLEVTIHYGNIPDRLPAGLESFFYFFLQETLVNSFRHGAATQVRISFWRGEERIGASVVDDGQGATEITEGIGIRGMRERLEKLGGELRIARLPRGFGITAEIPFAGGE
jgi:signal transduction histidine kinase